MPTYVWIIIDRILPAVHQKQVKNTKDEDSSTYVISITPRLEKRDHINILFTVKKQRYINVYSSNKLCYLMIITGIYIKY